jgi:hypothetical protein
MRKQNNECNAYIIDSYRMGETFHPGVMLYSGRRRKETVQWKTRSFTSLQKANEFVRKYCQGLGLQEVESEDRLAQKNPR